MQKNDIGEKNETQRTYSTADAGLRTEGVYAELERLSKAQLRRCPGDRSTRIYVEASTHVVDLLNVHVWAFLFRVRRKKTRIQSSQSKLGPVELERGKPHHAEPSP